jgi:hypothetical protein
MKSMGYGRWGWRARSILIHAGDVAGGCVEMPDSCSLIGTWMIRQNCRRPFCDSTSVAGIRGPGSGLWTSFQLTAGSYGFCETLLDVVGDSISGVSVSPVSKAGGCGASGASVAGFGAAFVAA